MTTLAHPAAESAHRRTQTHGLGAGSFRAHFAPRAVRTQSSGVLSAFGSTLKIALGLLCLLYMDLTLADSAPTGTSRCAVTSPQQAKSLADVLYEQGEYERAGECYEAAGDASRAQLAYLKAAGPNSKSAVRGLRDERDAAKALFTQVQQAFRVNH